MNYEVDHYKNCYNCKKFYTCGDKKSKWWPSVKELTCHVEDKKDEK